MGGGGGGIATVVPYLWVLALIGTGVEVGVVLFPNHMRLPVFRKLGVWMYHDCVGVATMLLTPLVSYLCSNRCTCSKDRVFRAVTLMGKEELQDILLKREAVKAKCDFCGTRYTLKPDELVEYLEKGMQQK